MFLSIIVIIGIVAISNSNINVYASTIEDKIYCNATINDNFDDRTIQVVLSQDLTNKDKIYTSNDFLEINCINVEELTGDLINKIRNGEDVLVDIENFRRVLKITIGNPGKQNVLDSISLLEQRNDVYAVSPDYYFECYATNPDDNPIYIRNQWSINNIDLPQAWDITTGSSDILVGIIDTGIDGGHIELDDRINDELSFDFANDAFFNPLVDNLGHGTYVAGIIGAEGDNQIGITGVCWDVTLVSLKVSNDDDGSMSSTAVVAAIYYAANKNIPIINMSLGTYYDNPSLANAIHTYDGLVVAAAGNDERNSDIYLHYPSSYAYDNIISVGASSRTNNIWVLNQQFGGSNYGKNNVDLFAPGDNVYSTLPSNKLGYASGTSMAAPHVAGVAALLLSKYPHLSATAIKEIIMNGVDLVKDSSGNNIFMDLCVSGGRLNAYNSLNGYKTISTGITTNVLSNLNEGNGLFGFYQYGSGFVKITMQATKESENVTYQYNSFRLLNDKGEVLKKCEMNNFMDEAVNKQNQNNFTVFLPKTGYYYIDVKYNDDNLTAINLLVENVDCYFPSINLFDYESNQEFTINLLSNGQEADYFKGIDIKQSSQYDLTFETTGTARFVVAKRNSTSALAGLNIYKNMLINGNTTIKLNLDEGSYYIGYFELSSNASASLTLTRRVTQYGSNYMVTDPDRWTNCGSKIDLIESNVGIDDRSYRQSYITEGFTRVVYFGSGSPSASRLDYDWYSSNEDVAIVTNYGTVLAKSVSQNQTVQIMAVYKRDPSKVFIKTFTIINDTKTYASNPINITVTMNARCLRYIKINLSGVNVPINMLQYYDWTCVDNDVLIDEWGRIFAQESAVGKTIEVIGTYQFNSRVKLKIMVTIIE